MEEATQPVTTPLTGGPASPAAGPAPGLPQPTDLTDQLIAGDFRILRTLGQGGMGSVYLAEQQSLKRKVALKFLRPEMAANPEALSRFRREAEAVARVNHANIVQVYAFGEADGRPFMALEYVEGRNLKEYVNRKGPLPLPVALTIIRQVAAALQRAAESGIIHRDIKPENILLTRKGEVKVADFGLSRNVASDPDLSLTQPGQTMGTPLYMSPEQVQGEPLDARSDIYSFGVTCYHMLAGKPPFRGQTGIEVAFKHVHEEPKSLAELRPDVPPAIVNLVHHMMSKKPAERPQSGRDVLRELSQPAGRTTENPFAGLAATPSETTVALPAVPRRQPPRAWLAGTVAVMFAGLAGVGLRLVLNAHSAPPGVEDHPNLPVASDQERRLLAATEFATAKSPDKVRLAAGAYVELGALYWEEKRYADAEGIFNEMASKTGVPATYKTIAKLGLAVTYALKDDVDRSNALFLEVRGNGGKAVIPPASLPAEDAVNLRHWIVTALSRNLTRPPVVKAIDDMRNELRFRPNMLGAGKIP
jgi:serine/threonine-protein kinase